MFDIFIVVLNQLHYAAWIHQKARRKAFPWSYHLGGNDWLLLLSDQTSIYLEINLAFVFYLSFFFNWKIHSCDINVWKGVHSVLDLGCNVQECNIEEVSDEEEAPPPKSSKDKKANGPDSKTPSLVIKITSKVPYKTVLKGMPFIFVLINCLVDSLSLPFACWNTWLCTLKFPWFCSSQRCFVKGGEYGG